MDKLRPSAILFDMDGVLVDSLDAWWKALNQALEKFGYNGVSREEFIKKYWGHDLFDNLKTMSIPLEVGVLCNRMYGEHVDDVKVYPNVKDVLQKLDGYKKSVITNTPRDSAVRILEKFDIKRFFMFVLTSNDVVRSKPDPEIVLKSCELLGVDPGDVVLVGDTRSDVVAGRRAGCKVVGVNVDADITIENLAQLLDFVVV